MPASSAAWTQAIAASSSTWQPWVIQLPYAISADGQAAAAQSTEFHAGEPSALDRVADVDRRASAVRQRRIIVARVAP